MDQFELNKLGVTPSGTKSYSMPPFQHTPELSEREVNSVANEIASEINKKYEPEQQLHLLTAIRNRVKENIRYRMDEDKLIIDDMRNQLEMEIKKNEILENLMEQI